MYKNDHNRRTVSCVLRELSSSPGDVVYKFFGARGLKRLFLPQNKYLKCETRGAHSGVHEQSSLPTRDAVSTDSHRRFGEPTASVFRVIFLQSIRSKLYKIFTSRLLYKA